MKRPEVRVTDKNDALVLRAAIANLIKTKRLEMKIEMRAVSLYDRLKAIPNG